MIACRLPALVMLPCWLLHDRARLRSKEHVLLDNGAGQLHPLVALTCALFQLDTRVLCQWSCLDNSPSLALLANRLCLHRTQRPGVSGRLSVTEQGRESAQYLRC